METYTYIIFAAIFVAAIILLARHYLPIEELPTPENGQVMLDRSNREWVLLRPLKNGTFLFRTPSGKMKSIDLKACEYFGFTNQFDFKSIQKFPNNE